MAKRSLLSERLSYDHLHGPPEDGCENGPKHVGAASLKWFLKLLLSVLSINVN